MIGKHELIDQVAEWIDTQDIAELVVDHAFRLEEPPTLEACQAVWLSCLEQLGADL